MTWIQQIFGQSVQTSHVMTIFLVCYLLGCFTTGYYLVRFRLGLDIRELESGNVGARNVGRTLGFQGFFITVLGDFGKGLFAVWMTRHYAPDDRMAALAMLAVVTGHIWPLQLGFRGGKGAATSLGALVWYDFHIAMVFVALFAVLYFVFRRVTFTGLAAFALLPLAVAFLDPEPFKPVVMTILAGLILAAHWKNLLEGFTLFAARRHAQSKPGQSNK